MKNPYEIKAACADRDDYNRALKGTVRFMDGEVLCFKTRRTSEGSRRLTLMTQIHRTPVTSPPREAAVTKWLNERYPASQGGA